MVLRPHSQGWVGGRHPVSLLASGFSPFPQGGGKTQAPHTAPTDAEGPDGDEKPALPLACSHTPHTGAHHGCRHLPVTPSTWPCCAPLTHGAGMDRPSLRDPCEGQVGFLSLTCVRSDPRASSPGPPPYTPATPAARGAGRSWEAGQRPMNISS